MLVGDVTEQEWEDYLFVLSCCQPDGFCGDSVRPDLETLRQSEPSPSGVRAVAGIVHLATMSDNVNVLGQLKSLVDTLSSAQ